jgi:single-strand DNA-binding protein
MPNHASITLIGHVGRDPEFKHVGEQDLASVSLAVTKKYKDKETTSWYDLNVWGKRANTFAQYVRRGDAVMIQGEPSIEKYTGNDGSEKTAVRVRVSDFTLLGGKKSLADTDRNTAPSMQGSLADEVRAQIKQATGGESEPPF